MASPAHDGERDESAEDIRRDEEDAARPAALYYPNVAEFVSDRLVHFVSRPAPGSGRVWCPEWYRHAEALSRLDSVWRAWEALRWDPGLGMSTWWAHHLDPNMRALMDPVTGPFVHCAEGHQGSLPLPMVPPPEGLFWDQRGPDSRNPLALD
ncbi:DUF4913 domain-containing protein [Streptomyces ipomoeae]|uniref:DUF4913 domain-containing protein n=1 Tax=Streptomyces ipomoeae TaxID=103232 RepID=UPI001146B937|nr:DUF4913 domain-containing protein [Streptomyces ipomoeae]MDX2937170.1 DUF4913 domain-containing protein [Streptomyces ipomoeae]TQE27771.1 DUF4913 domain-containing protein [Streptomyces ipomoeae]